MKRIEKYIEPALKEVATTLANENGTVEQVYNGYIASMGASIIQSGLLPTLAAFENSRKENTKADKSKVTKAILHILEPNCQYPTLLAYVLANKKEMVYHKEKIMDIAVALKLAIRTFKLVNSDA